MTAAHTPGPWIVSEARDRTLFITDAAGVRIAKIFGSTAVGGQSEKFMSRAKLLAAAPELEEALQACLAAFDARIMRDGLQGRSPAEARASERARAALAKAGL